MNKDGKLQTRILANCALIVIVLVTVGVSGWHYAYQRSRATFLDRRTAFEQDVERNLPLGSDISNVQKFLKLRNMISTELAPTPGQEGWYQNASNTLEGRTSDFKATLYECSIHVEFKFDATERLLGYRDTVPCTDIYF